MEMRMRKAASGVYDIWRKPVFRIFTSLVMLCVLLAILPLSALWQSVKQISLGLWLLSVIAFLLGHMLGTVKWRLLINVKRKILPLSVAFRCYFAGLFANLYLPSLTGGDVVRAGLALRSNREREAVIFGSLLDRFLDTGALVLIILVGALLSPAALGTQGRKVLFWVFLIWLAVVVGVVFFLIAPIPRAMPKPISESVMRLRAIINHLIHHPMRSLAALSAAIVIQAGFVLVIAFLGMRCGISLALPVWLVAWPLAKLFAMLPISMGGLGIREVALAILLSRFDIPAPQSVGLGLVWETILIAGCAVGGIYYFLSKS